MEGMMGVSGRHRLPASLFMGLALLASPMIGRTFAADPGSERPPAVSQAAPRSGGTLAAASATRLAFATGWSSLTRGVKADSPIQLAQGVISVTPNTVNTGASNTVTITTSGFFDLSQVTPSQIQVRPADGVSNFAITGQSAQHLALSFDVADTAVAGTRTLSISNSSGGPSVALDLTLQLGPNVCNPSCVSPAYCQSNQCVTPTPPPPDCNPACEGSSTCKYGQCVDKCSPHCGVGKVCVDDGSGGYKCEGKR
jgi:hypothetical protein